MGLCEVIVQYCAKMFSINRVCHIYIAFFIVKNGVSAETEVTHLRFDVTVEEDIPICVNKTIKGPMTTQQRFQVSAISSDKEFGNGVTICLFNDANNKQFGSTIRLEPKPGENEKRVVVSKILHFKPEMQGKRLVCKLGLDMYSNNTDVQTISNSDQQRSYPIAMCDINIQLEETRWSSRVINFGIESYKILLIVYGVGSVLVLIIIAQAIAMCVYGSRAVALNGEGDTARTDARSNSPERGTIYEDVIFNNREGPSDQSLSVHGQEPPPRPPKKPENKISPPPLPRKI